MSKKAKEAAAWVSKNPDTSIERIKKVIPVYNLALHRNQWIATFLKHLQPNLQKQFIKIWDKE